MRRIDIDTAAGRFAAWFSPRGLARLDFPERAGAQGRAPRPDPAPALPAAWLELTRQALARSLAGKAPGPLPPLDLSSGTDFQRQVWAALLQIPTGQTRTYREVASAIGRPQAARAVGMACGANPIPVLIPCHRVLPRSGGLGGFSAGALWKERLLSWEAPNPKTWGR